jgi:hypothetical protein
MPSDPKIRASDADRDRTAALLREHLAAGRLTAEEYHERLDLAYGSTCTNYPTPSCAAAGPAMYRSRGSAPGSSHGGVGFGGWR